MRHRTPGDHRRDSPANPGYTIHVYRHPTGSGYTWEVRDRQGRSLRDRNRVEWNRTRPCLYSRKDAREAAQASMYFECEVVYD